MKIKVLSCGATDKNNQGGELDKPNEPSNSLRET